MNSPVEEIKNRLSIAEVVGSYIELKQSGRSLKALCPFHQEKTPSFTVSEERQAYYCFGCGAGGDIFNFVEEFEGVDFRGALKILGQKAGVEINSFNKSSETREEKEVLYKLMEDATSLYEESLLKSETALQYVNERGIKEKTQTSFRLGFAPDSWSFILDELQKKGYAEKEIEAAGLIIPREGGGYYDRFRNRVLFPISDSSGRVIAFSGRTLSKDKEVAKYINSPETPIFKKRDVLYGIDKAKLSIRKVDFSILVEGQMDLVLSHQSGYHNTISTSGTALADNLGSVEGTPNIELIKRLSKNMVIAFDSDAAGRKAAIKNARTAFVLGMDVKIAELPEGKDPADVMREDIDQWRKIIRESKDVISFQLESAEKRSKDRKELLKYVRSEIFETVASIASPLEREHYLNLIAEYLGMKLETVMEEYRSFTPSTRSQVIKKKEVLQNKTEEQNLEEKERSHLLGLIYFSKDEKKKEYSKEFEAIFQVQPNELLDQLEVRLREQILFEAEKKLEKLNDFDYEVESLLKRFKIRELEKTSKDLLIKIREAEEGAEKETARKLLTSYDQVSKEIESLKNR